MDNPDSQSTHIIIQQGEGNLQGFEADQARGTYIMKVENNTHSSTNAIPEKSVIQKLIPSSQNEPKSDDTSTSEPTMSFEIIQEPLNGDNLFDYPVFSQEESRFSEQTDSDKAVLGSSQVTSDVIHVQTSTDKCENMSNVNISGPIMTTDNVISESISNNSGESLAVSLSSLPLPSEVDKTMTVINVDSQSPSKVFGSSQPTPQPHEKEKDSKDGDIIKKTIVEAFVKMVVCRKITVQKVDSKTGAVLNTDVQTEEEEPVVLGVDCVETTEDVINSDASKCEAKLGSGLSSKVGASVDGGLKFLSAVSESRQKINPSLIGSALLQSSLPKRISKALCCTTNTSPPVSESRCELSVVKTENTLEVSRAHDIKSEDLDDLNKDDSADYIPPSKRKLLRKSSVSSATNCKVEKSNLKDNNDGEHQMLELPNGLEHEKNGSSILLPKKRGRKRRWDKALGLAANLKTCQFCNKHFDSVKSCTKHMKKGECISALFCFICSKPFSSEEQLEKHVMSHGSSPKTSSFDCHDCRRSYRTKAGYMKHFRMGTCSKRDEFEDGETGDFPCQLCGSRFSTVDYLKLHRYKVHENPKDLHNCPDCGKKFHSFLGFQRHRAGRPCTEPLKCPVCGKTYKAKESFKIHMKHHKSEISGITFDCDACGRSYMTQTALTKHKLSHTGIKPYKCETCGKEFAMRYQVKDHARMHTGERPYLCSLCGSAFSNKGHLGRHLRSHENGTLLRRGRPKKIREPEESSSRDPGLKLIDVSQTLQTIDGQTIQVVDGQMFDSNNTNTPMIIQADNNTIIIAEGWPANSVPMTQPVASVPSSTE